MISNASVALLNRSHEEVQIVVEVKDVPSAYLSAYNAAVDGKKQLIRVPKQIPLVKGLPFMTHVSIRMDELNIRTRHLYHRPSFQVKWPALHTGHRA